MIRSGTLVVSVAGVEVIKLVEEGSVTVAVEDSPMVIVVVVGVLK